MLRTLFFALMTSCAVPASASDWQDLMKQPIQGEMHSIDMNSLVDLGGGKVEGWLRYQLSAPDKATARDGTPILFDQQLMRVIFDCKARRRQMVEAVLWNKGRVVLADKVASPRWESIPPDTIINAGWAWGCHRHYPTRSR